MSNNKEMWLACNDMGIWHMEHEGDYNEDDVLLLITVDHTGLPKIEVRSEKARTVSVGSGSVPNHIWVH